MIMQLCLLRVVLLGKMAVCCIIDLMRSRGLQEQIGELRCHWVRVLLVRLSQRKINVAIALSSSHVVACTSKGYVRVYTTQGVPVRLYRQKHMPVVTCASWKNYVMVVGNGGALGNGTSN